MIHTHKHSKHLPNAVQKQCPIVQLPCFVPPPNFTSTPRPLSLPQSAPSNYTGTRTQTHAYAQITQPADAKISVICKWRLKYRLALLLSHCHAIHVTNGCALVPKQWPWLRCTGPQTWPIPWPPALSHGSPSRFFSLIEMHFGPRAQRCHGVPQGLKACHKELRHSSLVCVWSKGGSCRFWGHYKFQ